MTGVTNTAIMDKLHELEVQFAKQNATIVTQIEGMYDACPHQVAIANGKKGWALAQTLQGKLANHRVELAKNIAAGGLGGGAAGMIILIGRAIGWW